MFRRLGSAAVLTVVAAFPAYADGCASLAADYAQAAKAMTTLTNWVDNLPDSSKVFPDGDQRDALRRVEASKEQLLPKLRDFNDALAQAKRALAECS